MAWLVTTIVNDVRLQLGAEEVLRPLPFGSNWSTLRIGIRCALHGGGGIQTNGVLFLGLCEGLRGFTDPLGVPEYLGVKPGSQTAFAPAAWTYFSGNPNYYRAESSGYSGYHILNGAQVATVNAAANIAHFAASPAGFRHALVVDITKGAPNTPTTWTLNCWGASAAQVVIDMTQASFYDKMNTATPPNLTQVGGTSSTFTYTGRSGLDTLSVFWKRSIPTLEISDIAVSRWA